MIELKHSRLQFSFPEVHRDAHLNIEFQRTLRLPDDDQSYPLPPGLGRFPLEHVDDHADKVPGAWRQHGGVMLPMFQSEALWINFTAGSSYPFLVKIATGKINAVTGEEYRPGAHRRPQDYLVIPEQPWLDGYCVKKGEVRQFVAMPLGQGYSTEEQITGRAEHGGLQIEVHPLKGEVWEELQEERNTVAQDIKLSCMVDYPVLCSINEKPDMGLAPGGRMRQDIEKDPHDLHDWDLTTGSRCFVHLTNSLNWRAITGQAPPTIPPTAEQYTAAGLPWFAHYGEGPALEGSSTLQGVKTVKQVGQEKGECPLPENVSTSPTNVQVVSRPNPYRVREGEF